MHSTSKGKKGRGGERKGREKRGGEGPHSYNPRIWKIEEELDRVQSHPIKIAFCFPGQSEFHEALSQKKKKGKKEERERRKTGMEGRGREGRRKSIA